MRIEYTIPATKDQSSCKIIGVSSPMESAQDNALWEYNSMRSHDGQPPRTTLPAGTTSVQLDNTPNDKHWCQA